jgi:hypothetical protein
MQCVRASCLGLALSVLSACSGHDASISDSSGSSSGGGNTGGAGDSGAAASSSGSGPSSGASSGSGSSSGGSTGSGGAADAGGDATAGGANDAGYPTVDASGDATPIGDPTLPRRLIIENHCAETIWTFALPKTTFPGSVPLQVDPGQSFAVGWPDKWSGRVWGRTACTGAPASLKCAQTGNDTLAEFTLTSGMASDWYDISLVDGFTLPLAILQLDAPWTPSPTYKPGGPLGEDGLCGSPVCAVNLLANCPASQQKKDAAGNVVTCVNGQNPGPIQQYFKAGCPTSYSWPYDDPQSLFRCQDAAQNAGAGAKDYKVVYCAAEGATPGFP